MAELPNQIDGGRAMVKRVLRRLHPDHADRRPCLFLLEVGAALLSVLAARDALLGAPGLALELPGAVGLWALLLPAAYCLELRECRAASDLRGQVRSPGIRAGISKL